MTTDGLRRRRGGPIYGSQGPAAAPIGIDESKTHHHDHHGWTANPRHSIAPHGNLREPLLPVDTSAEEANGGSLSQGTRACGREAAVAHSGAAPMRGLSAGSPRGDPIALTPRRSVRNYENARCDENGVRGSGNLADLLARVLAGLARGMRRTFAALSGTIPGIPAVAPFAMDAAMHAALAKVAERSRIPFDEPRDSFLLEALWSLGGDSTAAFERIGSHWSLLGFQGRDPATDLRACGRLSAAILVLLSPSGRGAATESALRAIVDHPSPGFLAAMTVQEADGAGDPFAPWHWGSTVRDLHDSGLNFALSVMAIIHVVLDGAGLAVAVPRTGGTPVLKACLAAALAEAASAARSSGPEHSDASDGANDRVPTATLIDMCGPDASSEVRPGDGAGITVTEASLATVVAAAMRPLVKTWREEGGTNVMHFPPVLAKARHRIEAAVHRHRPRGLSSLCRTLSEA